MAGGAMINPAAVQRGRDTVDRLHRLFGSSVFDSLEGGEAVAFPGDESAATAQSLIQRLTAPPPSPSRLAATTGDDALNVTQSDDKARVLRLLNSSSRRSPSPLRRSEPAAWPVATSLTPQPRRSLPSVPTAVAIAPNYSMQMRVQQRRIDRTRRSCALRGVPRSPVAGDTEDATRHRHQVKLDALSHEAELLTSLMKESVARKQRVEEAQALRRNAGTIIQEWRRYVAEHPETEAERDRADRERADRRFMRMVNAGMKDEVQRLKVIEETLTTARKWRIPKGVKAEVYKLPKVSCFFEATLVGELVVEEVETLTAGNVLWVKIYTPGLTGWVAAQFASEGVVRVQLLPEAERCGGTTVREFMLETLDDIGDIIDKALQQCPLERMKGPADVKDALGNAMINRQMLRDLPAGHAAFLKEAWDDLVGPTRNSDSPPGGANGGDSPVGAE